MRHLCICFWYYPEEVHKIFKLGLPSNPHLCYEYPKLRVRYIILSCNGTLSLHVVIIYCYEAVLVLWDICFFPRRSSQNLQTWPVAITHISAMSTPRLELGIPFHHTLGPFHYMHDIIVCYETMQVIQDICFSSTASTQQCFPGKSPGSELSPMVIPLSRNTGVLALPSVRYFWVI